MNKIMIRLKQKSDAQGLVEFALVLPVVLILGLGIIEAGRLMFIYSAANTASREAARYGSAAGDAGGYKPHYEDCAGIRNAARRMGSLAGIQDANITITYDRGPGTSSYATCTTNFTITNSSVKQVSLGDRVVVNIQANYQPIVPLVNLRSFTINSQARRTILKDVSVEGTPAPATKPEARFNMASLEVEEDNTTVTLGVELSFPTTGPVTVPIWVEAGSTATLGVDYDITSGPVVVPPGSTMSVITITIYEDNIDEDDEFVFISMGEPDNATLGEPRRFTLTIRDDDDPPTVSFSQAGQAVEEGDVTTYIGLQLSHPSSRIVTVPLEVAGTATRGEGQDFNIVNNQVTFPAGATSAALSVAIYEDEIDEEDETVVTVMGSPVNAVRGDITTHTLTIVDDDIPYVSFTWATQEVSESAGSFTVQIKLSIVSTKTILAPFSVSGTATPGSDFIQVTSSPITFVPGQTTADIDFTVIMDNVSNEEPETVVLTLGTPTNGAQLGNPRVHTTTIIEGTVTRPIVRFTSASQSQPENAGSISITIQLSSASASDVVVPFTVSGTATVGAQYDYTISPSPVVISAGGMTGVITITIIDDLMDEDDETIVVAMGTPINADKGNPSTHTLTIIDNDDPPVVSFLTASQTVAEDAGSTEVIVRLSAQSSRPITVPFTVSGTATQEEDFALTSSPLSIPAGSTSSRIVITVVDDQVYENNETIILTLGEPTNATSGTPNVHVVTITDNEPVCPSPDSLPSFGSGLEKNKLVWVLQNPDPLAVVNLTAVSIRWPSGAGANVTAITFGGGPIFSSVALPPYLMVDTPQPLWSGAFYTNQIIFKFDKNPKSVPGDFYEVTATFEGCPPISGIISSDIK